MSEQSDALGGVIILFAILAFAGYWFGWGTVVWVVIISLAAFFGFFGLQAFVSKRH